MTVETIRIPRRSITIRRVWLTGLVIGLVLGAGCRSSGEDDSGVSLEWHLTPDPPVTGPATFHFSLTDGVGQPVTGASVEIEGNMSHAGMTPVFGTARELSPGDYEADLELTMGGDWFIIVDATLSSGEHVKRQVEVPGVRPR
jgi:hypothetical protein